MIGVGVRSREVVEEMPGISAVRYIITVFIVQLEGFCNLCAFKRAKKSMQQENLYQGLSQGRLSMPPLPLDA